ncbi:Aclacinomycin methylesterase RdmC [bacterium HR29]|jgi:3-oxoadipate enol-lactonase|nr:Aclacinomycin methylesterase RdmC [bacterium HR29]
MPAARSGDWEIWWEARGRSGATALLLVIGLSHRAAHWGPLAELLAREFRVVLFDPRNIGRSSQRDEPSSLADETEDMLAVLDAAGCSQAWVYGRSRGGMLAQEFALRYPDRVRGLILEGTSDNGPSRVGPTRRVEEALRLVPGMSKEEIFARQNEAMAAPGWKDRDPEAFAALLETDLQSPPRRFAVLRQQEAVAGWSACGRLHLLRCPVLVICGEEDGMVPPENSRHLAAEIPGAELAIIPGMGHLGMWERPETLAELVSTFVARCKPAGGAAD